MGGSGYDVSLVSFAVVPLHIDEGSPRQSTFSVVGLPKTLFCTPPPRHTGGMRQVFDGWFA